MLIFELLRYECSASDANAQRVAAALSTTSPREFSWALDAGLGPLVHRIVESRRLTTHEPFAAAARGADLVARLRNQIRRKATADVLDVCAAVGAPVTLLKGISVAEQIYAAPHLRPMTDVDLLVPAEAASAVQEALLDSGFLQKAPLMAPGAHHGEPLRHPEADAWFEIHHALFPENSPLGRSRLFSPDVVSEHCVATTFEGHPVLRLADHLQFAYVAATWSRDLSLHTIHPSHVTPLRDGVLLIREAGSRLDWSAIWANTDDPLVLASALILADYLSAHGLATLPPSVLAELATRQRLIARIELSLLESIVHRHLITGRPFRPFNSWHVWRNLLEPGPRVVKVALLPWHVAFPPSYPDRFDLRAQARRIQRFLCRRTEPPDTRFDA